MHGAVQAPKVSRPRAVVARAAHSAPMLGRGGSVLRGLAAVVLPRVPLAEETVATPHAAAGRGEAAGASERAAPQLRGGVCSPPCGPQPVSTLWSARAPQPHVLHALGEARGQSSSACLRARLPELRAAEGRMRTHTTSCGPSQRQDVNSIDLRFQRYVMNGFPANMRDGMPPKVISTRFRSFLNSLRTLETVLPMSVRGDAAGERSDVQHPDRGRLWAPLRWLRQLRDRMRLCVERQEAEQPSGEPDGASFDANAMLQVHWEEIKRKLRQQDPSVKFGTLFGFDRAAEEPRERLR